MSASTAIRVGTSMRAIFVSHSHEVQVIPTLVVAAVIAAVWAATPSASRDKRLRPLQLEDVSPVLSLLITFSPLPGPLPMEGGPGSQLVLEHVSTAVFLLAHDEEFAVVDVAQVLEILDGEMIPLHQEHARHETVRDCFGRVHPLVSSH